MIHSMTDIQSIAAYLQRIGAEPRSLRVAVVTEKHGNYWTDIATIRINKDGTITAPADFSPTESEKANIIQDVLAAEWPTHIKVSKNFSLPEELEGAGTEDIFKLCDAQGNVVMIHQRIDLKKEAGKRYVPWTYWSDDRWRKMEPEGKLPLYGLETIGDNTTVFIHEGAKAARHVRRLINPRTTEEIEALKNHPWGTELQGAAHIGWIGGALSPSRTDWSALARAGVTRAYIVSDNDSPGKRSIPPISRNLKGITCFSIEFTEVFPVSFDLADEFPEKMFKKMGGHRHYVGPSFREVMHPATWATDVVPNPAGKGRPIIRLRDEFANLWLWIEELDTFVCREMPEINRQIVQFNSMVNPFSDSASTGQLLTKSYKGRTTKVCYRPDIKARIVTDKTTSAINLHTPTTIKPQKGDAAPWLEFMEYLIPDQRERKEMLRWCATLIAKPETRMIYSVLLVSEQQGMGKSTLGEKILAPLVGMQNTGFPTERSLVESGFNSWAAHKRLIVVGEIYTGQSFKAYNTLKPYVTDKTLEVNEKFLRTYIIDNWCHILACSNSKKALRMEETDRRWFYPRLSEIPWKREQWGKFYEWISSGGLSIIMNWAQNHNDYVKEGELAPITASKTELIDESRGEVINHWIDLLEAAEASEEEVVFALSEARDTLKMKHGKIFETPLQLKKEALRRGWKTLNIRLPIDGALSYIILSPNLAAKMRGNEEMPAPEAKEFAKPYLKRLKDRITNQF